MGDYDEFDDFEEVDYEGEDYDPSDKITQDYYLHKPLSLHQLHTYMQNIENGVEDPLEGLTKPMRSKVRNNIIDQDEPLTRDQVEQIQEK